MERPVKRLAFEAGRVARGATPVHLHLRQRLVAVALFTVIVGALASTAIFFLERHAPGTGIHTFGDAVFWTSTQLLTVSSQLPNPISGGARALDVFLQAYAISVVAALAGSFSAFFHHRSQQRSAEELG
jgi:hypothetical protein